MNCCIEQEILDNNVLLLDQLLLEFEVRGSLSYCGVQNSTHMVGFLIS